jgi:hypothetical protein
LVRSGLEEYMDDAHFNRFLADYKRRCFRVLDPRETLINGPTAQVAGEMASNFPDNEANRRSIRLVGRVNKPPYPHFSYA